MSPGCARSGGSGGYANVTGTVGEGSASYHPVYWDQNLTPVDSLDLRPYSQYNSLCKR